MTKCMRRLLQLTVHWIALSAMHWQADIEQTIWLSQGGVKSIAPQHFPSEQWVLLCMCSVEVLV